MKEVYIHILVPILLTIILNGFIYVRKWNNQINNNKYLPPGYIIGIVWIIILGLLGFAHYKIKNSIASYLIIIAILYSLTYPFLTRLKKNLKVYNGIAFILASMISISVYIEDKITFVYTIPFLLWTFYVNVTDLIS